MITFIARSPDGAQFTLEIGGARCTYGNDREGRRQAILDGLAAADTVTVGDAAYLPANAALEVVAAVLFPDGIRSGEQYALVCEVAEKACVHAGYGPEVTLGPPDVPFAARGAYRKRRPPVDRAQVLTALAQAGPSSFYPRQEIRHAVVWNGVARETYGRVLSSLDPEQQAQIRTAVDAIAAEAGWVDEAAGAQVYARPLPVNAAAARAQLDRYLAGADGRPLSVWALAGQAQAGAYGRRYQQETLAPELQAVLTAALVAHGYEAEPKGDEYRPVPPEIVADPTDAIAVLTPLDTSQGPALLLADVVAAVAPGAAGRLSDWQALQLVAEGQPARALRRRGFRTVPDWCRPEQFQPPRDGTGSVAVLLREVRVRHDPQRTVALADGLTVHTPALAVDEEDDTLVYLQLLGPREAVRANWAALAGGGRAHWLGRRRVQLRGMKEHVRVQTTLPCGWTDTILLHKQASLKEMNPERPFYLLDDGARPIPPLFYPMLNRALALPLLEAWTPYLWEAGRAEGLVELLDDGRGLGVAAWRVAPDRDAWQQRVQYGLTAGALRF